MDDACLFCGKGPWDGVAIFRINKPDQKGIYACDQHVDRTDAKIDPFVKKIAETFQGK